MHIKAGTLDDLLEESFRSLLKTRVHLKATKGPNAEIAGVMLELTQPRARLSRTEAKGHVFSCLGEFLWYLSCSNQLKPIQHYLHRYDRFAEPDGTIWGAYGPRIFGGERSQYEVVKELLKRKPTSRQAVIQLFDREDIEEHHEDVPCTCVLQFLQRDGLLHLVVHMRSNDAYYGLPHDVFSFTMIQEIMARDLDCGLGIYKHSVGSFHLYDSQREAAKTFLEEGIQATREMPPMPDGPQWNAITQTFVAERGLRQNGVAGVDAALEIAATVDPYWADLIRLLAIYTLTKGYKKEPDDRRLKRIAAISKDMASPFYRSYIRRRTRPLEASTEQMNLIERMSDAEVKERP